MEKTTREILVDVENTLDQLILNAKVMEGISQPTLFVEELTLLQKTQESLLAHLADRQDAYAKTEETSKAEGVAFERKLLRFGKLNARFVHKIRKRIKRRKRAKVMR